MGMNKANGCVFLIISGIAFIVAIADIPIGIITGNWAAEGPAWALWAFFAFLGTALSSPPGPPVRYCRRCGRRHSLPLGPNCPRLPLPLHRPGIEDPPVPLRPVARSE